MSGLPEIIINKNEVEAQSFCFFSKACNALSSTAKVNQSVTNDVLFMNGEMMDDVSELIEKDQEQKIGQKACAQEMGATCLGQSKDYC